MSSWGSILVTIVNPLTYSYLHSACDIVVNCKCEDIDNLTDRSGPSPGPVRVPPPRESFANGGFETCLLRDPRLADRALVASRLACFEIRDPLTDANGGFETCLLRDPRPADQSGCPGPGIYLIASP